MNVQEFIAEFNERFPDVDKIEGATDEMIEACEQKLGVRLPASFVSFLQEFSNGIFLLDWEPVGGVSGDAPCGEICKVENIIHDVAEEVEIVGPNEWVAAQRLISFSLFNAGDISNDHWVFICEENIPNNEYRVAFINQGGKILLVLDNFEEWLTIFWEANKDEDEIGMPVFHYFYPTFDERAKIL